MRVEAGKQAPQPVAGSNNPEVRVNQEAQNNPSNQQNPPAKSEFHQFYEKLKQDYQHPSKRVFALYQILFGNFFIMLSKSHKLLNWISLYSNSPIQPNLFKILERVKAKVPKLLQPFSTGLLLPLILLMFINSTLISDNNGKKTPQTTLLHNLHILTIILYLGAFLIGPGNIVTKQNQLKTVEILQKKPYYNSPQAVCQKCEIMKCLRSVHCGWCNQCIPKFTKHSFVLNRCIGASNELLYFLFLLVLLGSLGLTLLSSWSKNISLIVKFPFFLLNVYLFWLTLIETISLFTFNICYNLTQYEVLMWRRLPYLMDIKSPREFYNPFDIGADNNFGQSAYGLLGYPSQKMNPSSPQGSERIQKKYITNWGSSMLIQTSELVNHLHHDEIVRMTEEFEENMMRGMRRNQKIKDDVFEMYRGRKEMKEILGIISRETQEAMKKEYEEMNERRNQKERENREIGNKGIGEIRKGRGMMERMNEDRGGN